MRWDGTRVKGESAIMEATPYIMPRRYDAMNFITEYTEMDPMRAYIHQRRREGKSIGYMSLVIAAYHKAYLTNPKVNRFIMNKKVYQRSHFCVSFVMLKTRADGEPDETTLKVYIDDDDDVFDINDKIEALVEQNADSQHDNKTDKFASFMLSIPLLPSIVVGLARFLDNHGLLPRAIIDISPFHTSLFITNLASINASHIYHHTYDFGTTSIFACMGKPVPDFINGNYGKRIMPLSFVMDERICSGVEFARFGQTFLRYLKHPEMLEKPRLTPQPEEENALQETTA